MALDMCLILLREVKMEVFLSEHGGAILSGVVSICVMVVLFMVVEVLGGISLVGLEQIIG